MFTRIAMFSVAGVALIGGCASHVPTREQSFQGVAQTVSDRTGGARVQWNTGSAADRAVDEEVRAMLAKPLTADTAVQVALLRNESLQATYEDLGIAQAQLVEAGLLSNPRFGAEFRLPKYTALPVDFDLTQSFIDLLLLPVRKRAAGAVFEGAKQRVTGEVLNTAADAKAAFYRAQGAAQLVDLRRTVLAATDASFDAATRLHEAGNLNDLRWAQERALHEQAKLDLAKAEADAVAAREELNAVMGLWGEQTAWTVEPRLPDVPAAEVEGRGLESLAIRQRGDLAAMNAEVTQLAANLGVSKWSALGDVTVGAHYATETDGATSVGPNVSVPLPVFNQGQGAVAEGQARLRQATHRYQAMAVQVRADVRRTRAAMIAARQRAEYYAKVIVPLRHEITEGMLLQYNAMVSGLFELLQAKQMEVDAGREYVEALTDYWVTRARLEKVVGGRLTAVATTKPSS